MVFVKYAAAQVDSHHRRRKMAARVNLKELEYVARELRAEIRTGKRGPAHDMAEQWGARYLSFTQRRFKKMSRGGWAPLAKSTLKARKKGSGKKSASILIDEGHLLKGLKAGEKGNLTEYIINGVRVGYRADVKHPRSKTFTYGEIAAANQNGTGNLPKREIFVDPDNQTINGMKTDLTNAITALGQQAQR